VIRGTEAVRSALREDGAFLVLVATDAAEGQLGKIAGLLENRGIPSVALGTREELGHAVGGPPLSAVALTQRAFAEGFLKKLAAAPGAMGHADIDEDEATNAG